MDDNFNPKKPKKYLCEICDFVSCNKKDYDKHLLTLKHKKRTNGGQTDDVFTPHHIFNCECGKEYKHRQGLWKHKKICDSIKNSENDTPISSSEKQNEIKMLTELVKDVVKQNQDLTNKLVDICKNNSNTTISNNNINSHNKTFNLQFFLNETCKDAMNIMDFVDSLKLQLSDLETVGKIGYVEGISNIIVKNLNSLDETKRPIHCTDSKREVMYIKDEDKWEKENEEKKKLRKVIKHVAHKNSKLLPEFKKKYPNCDKSESKYSDKYDKLIIEAMGGKGDNDLEKEDKIIRNISKIVTIDKTNECN
jgi:hypothetical protein